MKDAGGCGHLLQARMMARCVRGSPPAMTALRTTVQIILMPSAGSTAALVWAG